MINKVKVTKRRAWGSVIVVSDELREGGRCGKNVHGTARRPRHAHPIRLVNMEFLHDPAFLSQPPKAYEQ